MREKLIELVRVPIKIMPDKELSPTIAFTMPYAEEVADNLIANGVTIPVRCKDCRYYIPKVDGTVGFCKCGEVCGYLTTMRVADDFCSYGERRTDGCSKRD